MKRILISLTVFLGLAGQALAWGPVGHETVAYIAEDNLTPGARLAVNSLLGPGETMASVSNWADKIRFEAKATAPWHFIDLPLRENLTIEAVKAFADQHPCVVSALEKETAVLKDVNEPKLKRYEALKFVIHFVGDLHQPFHCTDDNDRGGNDKLVRFKTPGRRGRGTKMKLHQLWDGLIETHTIENPRQFANELENNHFYQNRGGWESGSFTDWAFQTWQIDHSKILDEMNRDKMGPGPGDYSSNPLPADYYDNMRPIVDSQITMAGVRLAAVLNSIFQGEKN